MAALIMTVGGLGAPVTPSDGRPSIVDTLVDAVKSVQPAPHRVVLLHSTDSAPIAEVVALRLLEADFDPSLKLLCDHENLVDVYREVADTLRELRDEGIEPADIVVEYTSGTKPMSAGLVLAALDAGCGPFRYVGGGRNGGLVEHDLAAFLAVSPKPIRASREAALALRLFREMQFEAVKQVLPGGALSALDPYERRILENLRYLASAFECWDKFRHGELEASYRRVDFSLPELSDFELAPGIVARVAALHVNTSGSREGRQRFSARSLTLDHLADLWNNADRRLRSQRYDDAVARLYRLTEMIGQFVLMDRFGVDAGGVQLDDVKPDVREPVRSWLQAHRTREDDAWLMLQDVFSLLRTLRSPIGEALDRDSRLSRTLQGRNRSILAHGITPVTAADARSLQADVKHLAVQVDRGFERRCRELQFPWLT